MEKYYVIEREYVGPNQNNLSTDYHNIAFGHYFEIQDAPGRTNMSGEERLDGWLGTTSDWASYAHGEFDSEESAREWIEDQLSDGYRESDDDDELDPDVIARYYVGDETSVNIFDAAEWLHDSPPEISADSDLNKLAEEIEEEAKSEGVTLWNTLDYLEELQNNLE